MTEYPCFVLVGTYSWPTDAYLAKSRLDEEGILSKVTDEYLVSANWLYSRAIGGVKLFVEEQHAQAAMKALASDESALVEAAEGPNGDEPPALHCPVCGAQTPNWNSAWREVGTIGLILYYWPIAWSFTLGAPVLVALAIAKSRPCHHQRTKNPKCP